MQWRSLLAFVGLVAPSAHALIRFPCSQLVTERLDPLVTPGEVSPHVHQVIGGNAFNISMPLDTDLPKAASCTTCKFTEDKSNYWTAVMYFKHQNGSFMRVPQMPNHLTGSPNGGMTVYYIQPSRGQNVTIWPKGFRMIVGNPMLRARPSGDTSAPKAYFSSFRCWQTSGFTDADNSSPPGGSSQYDTIGLPPKSCAYGIRSHIFFPSCWNGKDLDPPDHSSHVAFFEGRVTPSAGIILMNGNCPASHPVKTPMLFYETVWDTRPFISMWPKDGSQPLVLSMGDPTGFGHHGDYVFGWEGDSLKRAMAECFDTLGLPDSCRTLKQQSDADMNKCVQQTRIDEKVEGVYLNQLPGCNPVQNGPGQATMPANCNAISTTGIGGQPPATPTVQPPVVTTPAPPVTQPPPPVTTAPQPLQTHWGQCGGQGWTGPTQCQAPYKCTVSNQYYSQCT